MREEEKHQCVVVCHAPPTGDLACNPGMCPDWELNWQPFASKSGAQTTEQHQQPGLVYISWKNSYAAFLLLNILTEDWSPFTLWDSLFYYLIHFFDIYLIVFFFKDLYLERGREGETERSIILWLPLTCPYWGPGPQPRHGPWLGIELATLCFAAGRSIHWATPARVLVFLRDPSKTYLVHKLSRRNKVSIFPIVFVILKFYSRAKHSIVIISQVFLLDYLLEWDSTQTTKIMLFLSQCWLCQKPSSSFKFSPKC